MILALDVGLKRTGAAAGSHATGTAQPVGLINIKQGQADWRMLDKLINEWQPKSIVIGDPQSDNPALKKLINRFKHHIQSQHKLPIDDISETLSTVAANHLMAELEIRNNKKTEMRDQMAACVILQSYLNQQNQDKKG